MFRVLIFLQMILLSAGFVVGCDDTSPADGDGDGDGDADGDGDGDVDAPCIDDEECDDGEYCNGLELCDPEAAGADDFGCLAGSEPCLEGEVCIEETDSCEEPDCLEPDVDGDGHDAAVCGGDDCDDADANRYPGNPEVCDADDHDEDCDPITFGFRDNDGDGEPDRECCNLDEASGEATCGSDCDDNRPGVNPTVPEVCDGLDNDCNGEVDEGVLITFFADADGDGYGSLDPEASTVEDCTQPVGYAASRNDCDDDMAEIHPGAVEECDEIDNNCDGSVDPGCECTDGETQPCGEPDGTGGFVEEGECAIGTQRCVDGLWAECVGEVRPRTETCNDLDEDCDGRIDNGVLRTFFLDADEDGYGDAATTTTACSEPSGYVANGTDCNDDAIAINPAASEECDEIDNDCDGEVDRADCACNDDEVVTCGTNRGECTTGTQRCTDGIWGDCLGDVEPTAERCNGLDDDCNGSVDDGEGAPPSYYRDSDGDGYGDPGVSIVQCSAPDGYVERGTDCDDTNSAIHPGAAELCDLVDSNCDEGGGARPEEDADGDGHATEDTTICIGGPMPQDDCMDNNDLVHPGQSAYFDVPADPCPDDYPWCWDYNCNGVEEQLPSGRYCDSTFGKGVCFPEGPLYSGDPPECGDSVDWQVCEDSSCTGFAVCWNCGTMPCH